ncbi:hypothetical protein [Marinobacter sp. ANT_B65]|uniref:hypothetical protein n=1 Tax=Marinobacter sp. ANT_B65 TaxID=2039467 RepID=UPI000BBEE6A9|nr:hypothetical protein [Marinobacter sp. ANT_B65]PCM45840.1 hypothetical protein CPA50_07705 [Marinobacter sp. ANT_B65]
MINISSDILEHLGAELVKAERVPATEFKPDENTAMPAELRNWLVRLRLLEGVPFANLVADSELLPQESIRWFYLDRRWTDAVVQGALSVGTVNSDDRIQIEAQYAAIRAELDTEERNVRRVEGMARFAGQPGPITGFLLRSSAVSGWPGLHVRAFNVDLVDKDDDRFPEDDPRRIRLLRLERLAPAVLLCIFDGIPKVVHIEEPRQGIQFGFMHKDNGNQRSAKLRPRAKADFEYLDKDGGKDIDVPFRVGSSGVVDIRRLSEALEAHDETGANEDGLNSAEYALQLIQFPWRQVFGEIQVPPIHEMFRASIEYVSMVNSTFKL